jgi:hypothetical protein
MTDAEFTRRFEDGRIRSEDFHHREHLRVAWVYLHESISTEAACDRMRTAIRGFARAAGKPGKYHETLTVFWVRLLADLRERTEVAPELETILPRHSCLLDKETPLAYYSRGRLFSDDARLTWQAPDLKPLGSHATAADSCASSRDTPSGSVPGRPA